jgi:TPR repeat protein
LSVHRHCPGKRLLARCLEEGIGCKKSPKKAAKELRDLSKDCYCAHTLCQLARLHHEEVVTSKEALKWLQDAVGQEPEHAESWYEKGLLHRDGGKGVAQQ